MKMSGFKINIKKYIFVLLVLIWTNSVHHLVTSEGGRYLLKTSTELTEDEKRDYAADGFEVLHQVIYNERV